MLKLLNVGYYGLKTPLATAVSDDEIKKVSIWLKDDKEDDGAIHWELIDVGIHINQLSPFAERGPY